MIKLARHLPPSIKLELKLVLRNIKDSADGNKKRFASKDLDLSLPRSKILVKQPIKRSHLYENKLHNIRLGAQAVEKVVIGPGQIFSYWHALGRPLERNGYKKGRNLINGQLSEDIGGGLCQLSGIIYHTSLLANLYVMERYPHTLDIYKEEDRYTPLGADATVVFGYKDLRILNNYDFPVMFDFEITDDDITCYLKTDQPLYPREIEFVADQNSKTKSVQTIDTNSKEVLTTSKYQAI